MEREKFGSRLGFILVSAGCAIGLGNVWKFPYMTGKYGGAAFILIYLVFLLILGLPIMVCEFSVGRASQTSIAASFRKLEPEGTKWHCLQWFGMAGNYLLIMFYTTVAGWMLYYCWRMASGEFVGADSQKVKTAFFSMQESTGTMIFWAFLVIFIAAGICFAGLQKGVEKVTKVMMICLLALMFVLAVHSVTLEGAGEGVRFYLIPDFQKMAENGIGTVVFGAMSQAFFTLSIGMGGMAIFGSYLTKERSLTGETLQIIGLDTFVALMAGLIVIPACFAFGVEPDAGPGLVFLTLPNIFTQMTGGRLWGTLFFLFLTFAALTTVIGVFENIISFAVDLGGMSRKKAVLLNLFVLLIGSLPCILGFGVLSGLQPLGAGTNIMDLEDFLVSNNILPLGSVIYLLFCTRKNAWGWKNFIQEANAGNGIPFPQKVRGYMTFVLPWIVVVIYLKGYFDMFRGKGAGLFGFWMAAAIVLLLMILTVAYIRPERKARD